MAARAWQRLPPVRRLIEERDALRAELARRTGPDPDDYEYLFIVTYGRSGSTLLNGVLNSIPGYLIRGENRFVVDYLHKWHRTMQRVLEDGRKTRLDPRNPFYGVRGYPPQQELVAMRYLVMTTLLRPGPHARVLGFKEIRWPAQDLDPVIDFIDTLFPRSRYLFNTRNAEDVAKSKWWREARDPIGQIAKREAHWAEVRKTLGDRAFHVRYDDYIADPESLRSLFEWLGEPFDLDQITKVLQTRHGY